MERYQLPVKSGNELLANQRKAMAARSRYAIAKRQLKGGARSLKSVLDDDGLQRMRVLDVLSALPGMGRVTASKLMGELGIARSRRLGGIGCRQYKRLLEALREP